MILRDVILAAQHGGAPRPPQMVARLSDFAKRRHELGTDGPADDEADGEIKEYFSRTESVPKDGKWGLSKHACRLRYVAMNQRNAFQKFPNSTTQFHLNDSTIVESIEVDLQGKNGVDKCVPAGRGRAGHETLTDRSRWRRGSEGRRRRREKETA